MTVTNSNLYGSEVRKMSAQRDVAAVSSTEPKEVRTDYCNKANPIKSETILAILPIANSAVSDDIRAPQQVNSDVSLAAEKSESFDVASNKLLLKGCPKLGLFEPVRFAPSSEQVSLWAKEPWQKEVAQVFITRCLTMPSTTTDEEILSFNEKGYLKPFMTLDLAGCSKISDETVERLHNDAKRFGIYKPIRDYMPKRQAETEDTPPRNVFPHPDFGDLLVGFGAIYCACAGIAAKQAIDVVADIYTGKGPVTAVSQNIKDLLTYGLTTALVGGSLAGYVGWAINKVIPGLKK